jgi:DNA-binding NtrC family response regulator
MYCVGLFSKDQKLASVLSSILGTEFTIVPAGYAGAAQTVAEKRSISTWVVDADLQLDLLQEWRTFLTNPSFAEGVPAILIASDENRPEILEFAGEKGYHCVRKPPQVRELKLLVRNACEHQTLKGRLETAQRAQSPAAFDELVGSSSKMQVVYDLIRRVAKLDTSVLITGESGTGKELIARAIHNTGSRAKRPFIALSSGAIPETLIEAELFGHEKGAYTGTVGAREGFLEKAGDGTLFLDEIGELSLNTQVKLLRVLQQREFTRLGSTRPIPLRARVIFATHRDLNAMVAAGTFRQDLLYRINVMNLHAPTLRERTEDVPLLAQNFLSRYSDSFGKYMEGIDSDALLLLRAYAWPGNVRELENVIQRAVIMAEETKLRACDLPEVIQDLDPVANDENLPSGSFERLLHDYKVRLVKEAIAQCNGNKTLAAQSLSISRAYLHRLIRATPLEEFPLSGVLQITELPQKQHAG